MKTIYAKIDDNDYRDLLEECFCRQMEEVKIVFFDSNANLKKQLAAQPPDILLLDVHDCAQEFLNSFPELVTFLTSPRYCPKIEKHASTIGAAGYFPRIQDAEVVAYLVEQISKCNFSKLSVH